MWRKALVLGLVLMTVGMVVGGAVEKGKFDIAYGIYRWHKTGDWRQAMGGVKAGTAALGSAAVATKFALKFGLKTVAKAIPYVGLAVWA